MFVFQLEGDELTFRSSRSSNSILKPRSYKHIVPTETHFEYKANFCTGLQEAHEKVISPALQHMGPAGYKAMGIITPLIPMNLSPLRLWPWEIAFFLAFSQPFLNCSEKVSSVFWCDRCQSIRAIEPSHSHAYCSRGSLFCLPPWLPAWMSFQK